MLRLWFGSVEADRMCTEGADYVTYKCISLTSKEPFQKVPHCPLNRHAQLPEQSLTRLIFDLYACRILRPLSNRLALHQAGRSSSCVTF
eukprot:4003869-Amphidinium_carterae.1